MQAHIKAEANVRTGQWAGYAGYKGLEGGFPEHHPGEIREEG